MTKAWSEKAGVIHDDWIENRCGKSIDFQGNVLFPQYDYTALEEACDSFIVITINDKKGIITRSGRLVVPCCYDSFNFLYLSQGLLVATEKDRLHNGDKDYDWNLIYTTQGKELATCFYEGQYLTLDYVYNADTPFLKVTINSTAESPYSLPHSEVLYLDGQRAHEGFLETKVIKIDGDSIYQINTAGDTVATVLTGKGETHSLVLPIKTPAQIIADLNDWQQQSDIWLSKALDYYDAQKYDDAIFCLNYYGKYCSSYAPVSINILAANYAYYALFAECLYNAGEYKWLMQMIKKWWRGKGCSPHSADKKDGEKQVKRHALWAGLRKST